MSLKLIFPLNQLVCEGLPGVLSLMPLYCVVSSTLLPENPAISQVSSVMERL